MSIYTFSVKNTRNLYYFGIIMINSKMNTWWRPVVLICFTVRRRLSYTGFHDGFLNFFRIKKSFPALPVQSYLSDRVVLIRQGKAFYYHLKIYARVPRGIFYQIFQINSAQTFLVPKAYPILTYTNDTPILRTNTDFTAQHTKNFDYISIKS